MIKKTTELKVDKQSIKEMIMRKENIQELQVEAFYLSKVGARMVLQ